MCQVTARNSRHTLVPERTPPTRRLRTRCAPWLTLSKLVSVWRPLKPPHTHRRRLTRLCAAAAVGITSELARNRETILSASRKVHTRAVVAAGSDGTHRHVAVWNGGTQAKETKSLTVQARRLVQGMRRRTMIQKVRVGGGASTAVVGRQSWWHF